MRELVSYDDIASEPLKTHLPSADGPGSPPKKRRRNFHRQGQRWNGHRAQNREYYEDKDEDETPPKKTRRDYGLHEESRQLAHEEIWDDSALIRAWDAAMEEYEVLNGPEKKWKAEPVNKSPLWFNIPPEPAVSSKTSIVGPSFLMPSIPAIFDVEQGGDAAPADPDNSHPVNFDTFVPQHDPSLSDARHEADHTLGDTATGAFRGVVPPPPAGMSTQMTPREAFEHAMGAWYWAGYWTGVYHSVANKRVPRSGTNHEANDAMVGNTEQEEQEVPSEQVEDSDLIPT